MLTILYCDDHLIAIDKPPGWLVHRSNIDRHETRIVVQALRDQIGRRVQPVHRLDKGTSGVLLFAFDAEATRACGLQFERNQVQKRYWAVVRGWPAEAGEIDHPLTREYDEYGRALPERLAQPAQTAYRRFASAELLHRVDRYPTSRYALVELTPLTGRRHQLRRHMKHIAHPIIGDATHGKGKHNRFFQQHFGCHRLLLACTDLCLMHPVTAAPLRISVPVGDQFLAVVDAMGWSRIAANFLSAGRA